MLARPPGGSCWDGDTDGAGGGRGEGGEGGDAVLEIGAELRGEEADGVDYRGGDQVVPRSQNEVAVDEEEGEE